MGSDANALGPTHTWQHPMDKVVSPKNPCRAEKGVKQHCCSRRNNIFCQHVLFGTLFCLFAGRACVPQTAGKHYVATCFLETPSANQREIIKSYVRTYLQRIHKETNLQRFLDPGCCLVLGCKYVCRCVFVYENNGNR